MKNFSVQIDTTNNFFNFSYHHPTVNMISNTSHEPKFSSRSTMKQLYEKRPIPNTLAQSVKKRPKHTPPRLKLDSKRQQICFLQSLDEWQDFLTNNIFQTSKLYSNIKDYFNSNFFSISDNTTSDNFAEGSNLNKLFSPKLCKTDIRSIFRQNHPHIFRY